MSMIETRHLRLVRAIAEEGGPTRAAARLHLTQSAVSHQLAELEDRLGVVLFARVRRQLKLTPAGERLVEAARSMLSDLSRLERDLVRAGARERVVVRVSVETFTAYHWLPRVLTALRKDHPHIDVRIVLAATREPVAALLRGDIELALASSPVRDRALAVEPLFDDEWTVIVAPTHPLATRPYVSATELGREKLFTHDAPRSDVDRMRELIAAERAAMPETESVPLTDALVELVKEGLGVGLVSRWAVGPALERGEVVARRFTRSGLHERWAAIYRRDAASRLPLAQLAELLRARPPIAPGRRARRTKR
ncbi:LysR family transcriptional regulator [Sandaracinus amylolyticus]|uniref:LysR family transcriptional regulator n=1 Tax=Sandaracinus amylolyticus TaxID=927083 RepID=UPI001F3FFBFB|nr:LysR substrate-binding domain-containing protein [Sandaracinus amylolyticus]UJR86417.1 Hypothetical protein I5071_85120 [Sandaracinus amylolyticus]